VLRCVSQSSCGQPFRNAFLLITCAFNTFTMTFSAPPIPGGSVIAFTLLFNRLGIPTEALAMVLSLDVIFDFLLTSVNIYCLPLALLNSASVQGLLKRDILRSKTAKPTSETK